MAEESERSFPFDADEIDGKYDREYLADDFARYFRAFISSGVFMKESTNLQVMENGDMTVILKPGQLIIDGYRYDNTDDIIIMIDPADGVLNRIDRISGTWSKEDKDIHYTLQKGMPSYEPVPPDCRRNEDTKDYVFADVYIKAGAISILQKDITDQRLNSEVCGIANPFNNIDTTSIFNQFTSWLEFTKDKGKTDVAALVEDMEGYLEMLEISGDNQLKEIVEVMRKFENMSEEQFLEWFNQMKDQLSEDAAGNLQLQIDDLHDTVVDLDSIEKSFRKVFFGEGYEESDTDPEAMTPGDISSALSTLWDGETSEDATAMSREDVDSAVSTPWNGESSEDPDAMSSDDVREATGVH